MAPLFNERERAAEGIFVRDEDLRFLARREGLNALGAWSAESLGLTPTDARAYRDKLVDAFVAGTPEDVIVRGVQTDLERGGKPTLSSHVDTVLAQAVAEASERLRHGPPATPSPLAGDPRGEWDAHHRTQGHTFGWSL